MDTLQFIRNALGAVLAFVIPTLILKAILAHFDTDFKDLGWLLYFFQGVLGTIIAVTVATIWYSYLQHDPLTKIPTRPLLSKKLSLFVKRKTPFALICLTVDKYVLFNNTLGHPYGDYLLRLCTARIKAVLPEHSLIYRTGSKEFMLLLLGRFNNDQIQDIWESLTESLNVAWEIETHRVRANLDVSAGFIIYPDDILIIDDAMELLRRATIAASVGRKHKTLIKYAEVLDEFSKEGLVLATGLKQAIVDKQIDIVYQPKIDLKRRVVVAVELLARWNHPILGYLSPDKFIAYAERAGTVQDLTKHVLIKAFEQLKIWDEQGIHIDAAINISAACLDATLLPFVTGVMANNPQVLSSRITFEVTETSLMENIESCTKILMCLSMMGFKISVDDFGTGYSSMLYLRNMPISEIKIDKVFVRDMNITEQDFKIVNFTIMLGHELNCKIVAEGIEDRATVVRLLQMGCDVGQGYYFAKPLPASKITAEYLNHICNLV